MNSDHAHPASAGPRDTAGPATVARLLARLETMPVIEQAKGIIMAKAGRPEAEAFDLLRQVSQRRSVPIQDLAVWIIASTVRHPQPQPVQGTHISRPGPAPASSAGPRPRPPVSGILLPIGEL